MILPTYNEAENIQRIIEGVFQQSEKVESHAICVLVVDDDSPDRTQNIVKGLAQKTPDLHLITGPKKGLGEAYKRGFSYAQEVLSSDLIFEMDADGQHDPAMIPVFIALANKGFDLVIGSRFVQGGSTPDFSARRKILSVLGNWLIRFFGGISGVRDCTSGFRCIKTILLKECNLEFLSTRGYSFQSSLLCELLRNRAKVIEVPIIFPDRKLGKSKLSVRDQLEFLINIPKIRFRRSEEFLRYCVVGSSGVLVNLSLYIVLTRIFGVNIKLASPIAIEMSILNNFFLNNLWTFRLRAPENSIFSRLFKFHCVACTAGAVNYLSFLAMIDLFNLHDLFSNTIAILIGVWINYYLNSVWTWKEMRTD